VAATVASATTKATSSATTKATSSAETATTAGGLSGVNYFFR
jgi:hypothetical protein